MALAPARAYRELTRLKPAGTWLVALERPAFHQAIVWTLAGTYVLQAVGIWPRLLGTENDREAWRG